MVKTLDQSCQNPAKSGNGLLTGVSVGGTIAVAVCGMTAAVAVGIRDGVSELHEHAMITIARTVPDKTIQNFLVVFMLILLFHNSIRFFLGDSFLLVARKKVLRIPRALDDDIVLLAALSSKNYVYRNSKSK
jgi:hypothetical protein